MPHCRNMIVDSCTRGPSGPEESTQFLKMSRRQQDGGGGGGGYGTEVRRFCYVCAHARDCFVFTLTKNWKSLGLWFINSSFMY